jgi:hypothetical protein
VSAEAIVDPLHPKELYEQIYLRGLARGAERMVENRADLSLKFKKVLSGMIKSIAPISHAQC